MEGNSVMRPIDSLLIATRVTQSPPILRSAHPGSRPHPYRFKFCIRHRCCGRIGRRRALWCNPESQICGSFNTGTRVILSPRNYASTFPRASRLPRQRHPLGFGPCCNGCKRNGEILRLSSRMLQLGLNTCSCREAAGPPARTGRD
jgi:hypothetical protein